MQYRAVGNRCAIILDSLRLPISREKAMAILAKKGFKIINVDLIALARKCIGTSRYRRGIQASMAPSIVDCSSFVKWLYGQRGIWLPRRSIQQRDFGEIVNLDELAAYDLVFVSGSRDYYVTDPKNGVGHVGIATGNGTVIHAADRKANVVETRLEKFIGQNKFRGARRYIPQNQEVITLKTPARREVETSDDIKWIILQSLPEK